jgi:hypothetical protein
MGIYHTMEQDKKPTELIHYVDGVEIGEDGISTFKKKTKKVTMSSGRRYYNCLYLLTGLPPMSRDLMDYLVEEMNSDNIVYNNTDFRLKFINFIIKITSDGPPHDKPTIYSDQRVKESFGILASRGLILSKARGVFKVNPDFFFAGSEMNRIAQITLEMEFNAEDPETFKIKSTPKLK